ncbi:MAG: NAD-dependent DNA ligase LigA [Mediterraneibacter faecis]
MMNKVDRIKELISTLNKASDAYYNSGDPIMTDYEWDNLYDELAKLEEETGVVYPNSPTQQVGYSVVDKIKEVEHNHPMLSLDKTKSSSELIRFAGKKDCVLSVKCDGLTCSLRYKNGKLISAETRGNGVSGCDVLVNVLTIANVPHEIPYKEDLTIDGEVVIDWNTFNKINENLPEDKKYKHPRNLVSGSLTLLDSKEASNRNMRFIAWRVIKGFSHESMFFDLKEAEKNGFEVVPMFTYSNNSTDKENIDAILERIRDMANEESIPYDGAVIAVDDYRIAESMGRTNKFFRHSIAYKYEDELFETILTDIEWNTSKTGLINPVAIFKPVDLSGAITSRATLHNITYIKNMMLGIGDRIRIYRSNMVIPKVHDSIDKSGNFTIPSTCPICGEPTKIVKDNDSEVLMCTNDNCAGKLLGKLCHSVSKNALNIEGLSEATIQKFIDLGWLKSIRDIYYLYLHKIDMYKLEGFGRKSVNKLLSSIEDSRNTDLVRYIYAQSIPLIGHTASKAISKMCDGDLNTFIEHMSKGAKAFGKIDGIGSEMIKSLKKWWDINYLEFVDAATVFTFKKKEPVNISGTDLTGKVFVITGSLIQFRNRDEMKERIESLGGKVSGSVSAKTTALINNDIESTSSKNKKAKQLNVPILTENMFMEKYLQ